MNDYTPKPSKPNKKNKFSFVEEFVDTLTDGTTILPVSEKELVETVYYRKHPKSEKHVVEGSQSSGVDEMFSRDGVRQFLGEAFHEVDIFKMTYNCFYSDLSVRFLLSVLIITNIIYSIHWI